MRAETAWVLVILLALAMVVGLSACGEGGPTTTRPELPSDSNPWSIDYVELRTDDGDLVRCFVLNRTQGGGISCDFDG